MAGSFERTAYHPLVLDALRIYSERSIAQGFAIHESILYTDMGYRRAPRP